MNMDQSAAFSAQSAFLVFNYHCNTPTQPLLSSSPFTPEKFICSQLVGQVPLCSGVRMWQDVIFAGYLWCEFFLHVGGCCLL